MYAMKVLPIKNVARRLMAKSREDKVYPNVCLLVLEAIERGLEVTVRKHGKKIVVVMSSPES